MRFFPIIGVLLSWVFVGSAQIVRQPVPDKLVAVSAPVRISVNLDEKKGPMDPVYAWFGHDEPNYTYMKDGRKLLSELADLSPVPVHVRTHNLLTSGDGQPALKWGSTNAYTELTHWPQWTTGKLPS